MPSELINHSARGNKASINTQKNAVWRASELVNTWRFGEGGLSGEGMEHHTHSPHLSISSTCLSLRHLLLWKPGYLVSNAFDCVDHNKLWKILKEMGIPDHLTCLLRNLYAGQEATVRTGHGTTDGLQIRKGVHKGCVLSPCLFNLYAGYIMRNARLEEAQAGIKIAGRNINNLNLQMTPSLWQKVKRN